jgi:hypothetical protein
MDFTPEFSEIKGLEKICRCFPVNALPQKGRNEQSTQDRDGKLS